MQLYTKILIGLVLGVLAGLVANILELTWLETVLVWIEPLGTLFIRLITMVVIPLVVASLLVGTASLGDLRKLGRIGSRTVVYYLTTTAIAVTIGLVLSNLILPGSRIDEGTRDSLAQAGEADAAGRMELAAEAPTVVETLLGMVPSNPIAAAAGGDLLPLIVFTIIFGAALSIIPGARRDAVLEFFKGVNDAVMILIGWIMRMAPYAVFALIAGVIAQFGIELLQTLLVYCITVALGLLLHATGTFSAVLAFLVRVNPITFFRRIAEAPLVAFSTSSSNATLPVTMKTAERKVGISKEVSSFVLPLGATVNMDGTALYQAVAVMFIAQLYGIPLGLGEQLIIVLTATLASIGAAGVPSAGIIILILVLQSVGLGPQAQAGIAMILGVDRILDMMRTSVNVTGDLTAATFIAHTEGERIDLDAPIPQPGEAPATATAAAD